MADRILHGPDQADNPTPLPRDLGLGVTMLDVDYLRDYALRLWDSGKAESEYERLEEIADRLEEAVREIGILRHALKLDDEVA